VIGVISSAQDKAVMEEFFELFKTPWETFHPARSYDVVLITAREIPAEIDAKLCIVFSSVDTSLHVRHGLRTCPRSAFTASILGNDVPLYTSSCALVAGDRESSPGMVISTAGESPCCFIAYDLFAEVRHLLTVGQPSEYSMLPVLDIHIDILRKAILRHGFPVVEIPPVPVGFSFCACLTHDIDFVSFRHHRFDRTMAGFLYRATIGTARDFFTGRKSLRQLLRNWAAVAELPFIQVGLRRDYWLPFDRYLKAEAGRPSTFYLIPFKNRPGTALGNSNNEKRSSGYDISDVAPWISTLRAHHCEVALHGLDAWNSVEQARVESGRFKEYASDLPRGIRMHWLYFAEDSALALDEAGFDYDSTSGYNDAVGYRAGTGQVFKPLNAKQLLELPMHIQDTALFYPGRMHLRPAEAWSLCEQLIANARRFNGVLTLLWHDRSLVPERLWGDFYARLLRELDAAHAWWATAEQITRWFRARRTVTFRSVSRRNDSFEVDLCSAPKLSDAPDFLIRVSIPGDNGSLTQIEEPISGQQNLVLRLPSDTWRFHSPERPRPVTPAALVA
jgi:hypothetical protein